MERAHAWSLRACSTQCAYSAEHAMCSIGTCLAPQAVAPARRSGFNSPTPSMQTGNLLKRSHEWCQKNCEGRASKEANEVKPRKEEQESTKKEAIKQGERVDILNKAKKMLA